MARTESGEAVSNIIQAVKMSVCRIRQPCKPVICHTALTPTGTQIELLHAAKAVLTKSVQCLHDEEQLSTEFYVLTRALYMKHGQLRQEKSFRGLKQVRMCVKKFFDLDLERILKEMETDFRNAVLEEGIRTHLPSRQMWHYLLKEILRAASLLGHTVTRCTNVFLLVHQHLTAGMLIPTNMLFLSLLSRIWACCKGLFLELHTWYQVLKPVLDVLKPTEVGTIPSEESLPNDFSAWLTVKGVTCGPAIQESGEDAITALMTKYQTCTVEEREEIELDYSPPVPMEEDTGDPVNMEEDLEKFDVDPPSDLKPLKRGLTPFEKKLKYRIERAPSFDVLQSILLEFTSWANMRSIKRMADRLTELQIKSQEVKDDKEQVLALLKRGSRRLIRFFSLGLFRPKTFRSEKQPDHTSLKRDHGSTESPVMLPESDTKRLRRAMSDSAIGEFMVSCKRAVSKRVGGCSESKATKKTGCVCGISFQSRKQKMKSKKVVDTARRLHVLPLMQDHDSSQGRPTKAGSVSDCKRKTKKKVRSQVNKLVDDLKLVGLSSPVRASRGSKSKKTKASDSVSGRPTKAGSVSDCKRKTKEKVRSQVNKLVDDQKLAGLSSPVRASRGSKSKKTKASDSVSGADPKSKKERKKKLKISKLVNALNQLELLSQK